MQKSIDDINKHNEA